MKSLCFMKRVKIIIIQYLFLVFLLSQFYQRMICLLTTLDTLYAIQRASISFFFFFFIVTTWHIRFLQAVTDKCHILFWVTSKGHSNEWANESLWQHYPLSGILCDDKYLPRIVPILHFLRILLDFFTKLSVCIRKSFSKACLVLIVIILTCYYALIDKPRKLFLFSLNMPKKHSAISSIIPVYFREFVLVYALGFYVGSAFIASASESRRVKLLKRKSNGYWHLRNVFDLFPSKNKPFVYCTARKSIIFQRTVWDVVLKKVTLEEMCKKIF